MEERIKELFSNEEYVKGLLELGSYEVAVAKLAEDGVEVPEEDLKKLVELLKKKQNGELSDEDLEEVAGGCVVVPIVALVAVITVPVGITAIIKKC